MAVDKNFVVRNGLEVNSDLIVTDTSDSSNKKVGIASTGPRVTLDVRGGIAATDLNVTGVATIATVDINAGDIEVSQIDATSINVAGITTLANVAITNVNISGVATFADITYDEISGRNLNLTGIATIPSQANLNVTGLATIPTISNTPSFSGGAVVTGVVTASQFSGDGSQLTGLGVGIKTSGGTIGFGFTTLNFIGSGNTFAVNGTTVDISIAGGGGGGGSASIGIGTTVGDAFSGIVTAGNLWYNTGEGRLFIYFQDATSAQWIDAAPFNVGIITTLQGQIDFSAGSASAPSITFNNDGDSGFFQAATNQPGVAAAGSQVARFNPGGVNVTGVVSATTFVGELNSSTLDTVDGGAVVTGVLTATSFAGDGSNLSNLPAGLGTALSSDNTSPLNKIYFTDQVLGVASTITIDPPSTAVVAYTQYADIQVTGDADLIIGDGDEFITDILGIGTTSVRANLGGSGGRVLADNYLDSSGTGAPTFPSGVNVTGIVTATSFVGSGTALTGIDAATLKFGSDTKAQAVGTGVVVTGILTATSAVFDGNVTVGGTITYQDATSIDVLGIGTFQQGIQVLANGANVTGIVTVGLSTIKSGEIDVLGVVTATTFKAGTAISITDGAISATRFHGSGADLTGITATPTISTDGQAPNNAVVFLDLSNAQDHRLIVSGITTISCTGGSEGDSHTVRIVNSGIATVGFSTAFLFPSGASPSMPTADGANSLITFTINKAGAAGTELFAGASLNFS